MTGRKNPYNTAFLLIFFTLLLIVGIIFSLKTGRYPVPLNFTKWDKRMQTVFFNLRLPRIILACLVGSCLSGAGTAYQAIFSNPMAAPDILGASSGAAFGAAIAILAGLARFGITLSAFLFGIITILLVMIIGQQSKGNKVTSLILAGIIVSSLFSAGTSYIKLIADPENELPAITYWLMGSLGGTSINDLSYAFYPMTAGSLILLLFRNQLDLLTLNEDEAKSMGLHTSIYRVTLILAATLITAASVAVSGMISWVGLVIPHMIRRICGNRNRVLLPISMLFGAFFLLMIDTISRTALSVEIPIGILTSFIGAPFFLYLMIRKTNNDEEIERGEV